MNPRYTDGYLRDYYSRYTVEEPWWDEPLLYCHGFYLSLVEKFLPGPGRLFDVGSGKGHLLRAAVSRGWKVTGYEIDPATAVSIGSKTGVEVMHGNFPDLPLADGSLDAVTIHHVLEHLKDPVPYIRKVYSILRPGGILFIALPNIRGLASTVKFFLERAGLRRKNTGAYYDTGHHLWYFTPSTLDRFLSQHGFRTLYMRSGHRVLPGQSRFTRWMMRTITERPVWKSTFILISRKT